jgi:hypothetical protein
MASFTISFAILEGQSHEAMLSARKIGSVLQIDMFDDPISFT